MGANFNGYGGFSGFSVKGYGHGHGTHEPTYPDEETLANEPNIFESMLGDFETTLGDMGDATYHGLQYAQVGNEDNEHTAQ